MHRSASLRLSLFGIPTISIVSADGGSRTVSLAGRPFRLLVYLALSRGKFFTRAELASTLWEDGDGAGAGTFNTTLWRLRRAVEVPPLAPGALIARDRGGAIGLLSNRCLQLDLEEFEHLVASALAKPIEGMEVRDVECLHEGVARYKDDILAGFSDEWALREREKCRRRYLHALRRLMQRCSLTRDYAAAIRYAHEILDRDMLCEDIHRDLMRLLLASGQRALALRQFELCRTVLRKELAIHPMRETVALYQCIAEQAVKHDDL